MIVQECRMQGMPLSWRVQQVAYINLTLRHHTFKITNDLLTIIIILESFYLTQLETITYQKLSLSPSSDIDIDNTMFCSGTFLFLKQFRTKSKLKLNPKVNNASSITHKTAMNLSSIYARDYPNCN